jgi:copper(I)-binding protein
MKTLIILAALLAASPALAHAYKAGPLQIAHPWARETPVGATMGAGYLSVTNTGTEADRLIAVETAGAAKVEMHESTTENGVAKMRPVTAVEIPAGVTTALKPGGFHLMLVGLKESLAEGMRIPAVLVFEKAGRVEVELAVEGMGYGGAAEHKH